MQIKAKARAVARRSPYLRRVMRKMRYVVQRFRFCIHTAGIRPDPHTVVFSVFDGKACADSPRAIYACLQADAAYRAYRFVWLFQQPDRYPELAQQDRTQCLEMGSRAAERALASAGYWIFNYSAPDFWIPRKGQIYLQCWHGTPLKRLGYDIRHLDNAMNTTAEVRSRYRHDARRFSYLLSPCAFATEKFISAWNLSAAHREQDVLELGYPRNDFLVHYTDADVRRIKTRLGLAHESRKLLLYAPTWRDNQYSASQGYTYDCMLDFDRLQREFGDTCVILFRAHYLIASAFDFEKYSGFVYDVSDVDEISELYVIADLLITDYSSAMFDYAVLERPMVFYMYDLADYRDQMHGFYMDLDGLPGPVVQTEDALVEALRDPGTWQLHPGYPAFNERFNSLSDGRAAERVVHRLFDADDGVTAD